MDPRYRSSDPPVSPDKTRSNKDKIWYSPNNQAKCQRCGNKIYKGEIRVGIYGRFQLRNGQTVWNHKYYHDSCVSSDTKRKLFLDTPEEQRLAGQSPTKKVRTDILTERQRYELTEDLHRLRLLLASNQGCEDKVYYIFSNATLDDLVAHLPSNKEELLKIYGIAARKCQMYGEAILEVIERHVGRPSCPARRALNMDEGDQSIGRNEVCEDKDDLVDVGRSLTVDEIVKKKFRAAEARGEVFDLVEEGHV